MICSDNYFGNLEQHPQVQKAKGGFSQIGIMGGVNCSEILHEVRVIKVKKSGLTRIFEKKLCILDILSESGLQKFLIFCMMVEGNKVHHLSMLCSGIIQEFLMEIF